MWGGKGEEEARKHIWAGRGGCECCVKSEL